nr:hypothetical protein CFP56_33716 [Quercus suber]
MVMGVGFARNVVVDGREKRENVGGSSANHPRTGLGRQDEVDTRMNSDGSTVRRSGTNARKDACERDDSDQC